MFVILTNMEATLAISINKCSCKEMLIAKQQQLSFQKTIFFIISVHEIFEIYAGELYTSPFNYQMECCEAYVGMRRI